jgi:hypothetical protein
MKTSNMKRTAGVLALLVLFGGAEAIAQSGMNKGSLSTGQTINGGIPDAPIGHRQPRAGDVPSEKNLSNPNDPMNKEDAALDKKIKSICRGC